MTFGESTLRQPSMAEAPASASTDTRPSTVWLVALPGWRAETLATRLAAAYPHGRVRRAEISAAWAGLLEHPESCAIALIDDPVAHAIEALVDDPQAPLAPAFEAWRSAADLLLTSVRAAPARWRCLDAGESSVNPAAAQHVISDWLGDIDERLAGPTDDEDWLDLLQSGLLNALPAGLLQSTPQLDELQALCLLLPDPRSPDRMASLRRATQARRALLDHVVTLEARIAQMRADLLQAVADVGQAGLAQETLHRQHVAAAQTLRNERDSARQDLKLTQLHDAVARKELERLLAASETSVRLLSARVAEAEAARTALSTRLDAVKSSAKAVWLPGVPVLQVTESAETERHDDLVPHRHLGLSLLQVRWAGRRWQRLDLRLVEHNGRAGLLFFLNPGSAPPIGSWAANGDEFGRPYLLLIPSDTRGRQVLEHLGRGDWHFVVAVTAWLATAIAELPERRSTWRRVAARLWRELAEMPPRLRYDQIEVEHGSLSTGSVVLHLKGAMFGLRDFGELSLWLKSDNGRASTSRLVLLSPPPGQEPPLVAWPVGDDGEPIAELPLPVGACSTSARRAFWSGLGPADAGLVLGLMDSLPAAAEQFAGDPAGHWRGLAAQLRDEAHALARAMRWRRWFGRLRRRGSADGAGLAA